MVKRLVLIVSLALLATAPADATERILDYRSDITVLSDGSIDVVETIRVVAEGDRIKRGIYRDFPTIYRGPFFTRVNVPFEVISVMRNGESEPWHTEGQSNGVRVYAGQSEVLIPNGEHVYEFHYRTDRQLGYFEDHDELYWNVTGNGWEFVIEKASARVILPDPVPRSEVSFEAYVGVAGSKARDFHAGFDSSGGITFQTTRTLEATEGLTIVASWPKGFVSEPTDEEKRTEFWASNPSLAWGIGGFILVLAWYLGAWFVVGRDPEKGTIIPLFEPPRDMSPAAARHLVEMGYDKTCFAVAILNLAVRGHAKLIENEGDFSLEPTTGSEKKLSSGEEEIRGTLLAGGRIELKQKNHATIRKAIEAHKKVLELEQRGQLFEANRGWVVPGVLLSIATLVLAVIRTGGPQAIGGAFMLIWLSGWTAGVFAILAGVVAAWRQVLRPGAGAVKKWLSLFGAIFITGFSLPFIAGEGFGIFMLATMTSIWVVLLLFLLIAVNALFWSLIKAPTAAGRKLMDAIEGFRMYLGAAESDRVRSMRGPEKTPELFEMYLPYAIALGVESEWAEQFGDVLAAAGKTPESGGYRSHWYTGSSLNNLAPAAFAGALGGAFAGAVASSSTAPGSSSGSGGGGSSGGGGGGGGGGGW